MISGVVKMRFSSRFFSLVLLALSLVSFAAVAAPTPSSSAIPASPVAAEIGKQVQELVTGDPNTEIEPQETFGTRALGFLLSTGKLLVEETAYFVNNFAALPQLSSWANQQINNPIIFNQWLATAQLLAIVILCSLASGWLMDLALLPVRRRLYRKNITSSLKKAMVVFSWLGVSLIPVLAFVGSALILVDQSSPSKLTSFLVLSTVFAFATLRLVRVFLQFILFPKAPLLRLIPLLTEQTVSIIRWVSWYAGIAIFGFTIAEMAKVVKVPDAAILGFRGIVALVIVGLTIAVIVRNRAFVSAFVRGDLTAAKQNLSLGESLRLWLARTWHVLAIAYLVLGYIVTMLGPSGGFQTMQTGTVGTIIVLLATRLVFHMQARIASEHQTQEHVSGIYRPILKLFIKIGASVLAAAGIAASWGVDVAALALSPWGQRVLGSAFTISSTIIGLVLVYELIHRAIERKLNRRDRDGNLLKADARSQTFLPMLRNVAIVALVMIAGLVMLSELGIDTTPLLAGAGVLGVALGFGSQSLVKDFLTGMFIIIENSLAVGDTVKLGSHEGVVEGMTIRTVRLRDPQGALHILPFSEISQITNMSKSFAFAMIVVGVDYGSNLEHVMQIMTDVGEELRHDPKYASKILQPVEVLGVDEFGDSAINVRCRLKTLGGDQFAVRRAFLLKLKYAFDKAGVQIPYPHVVYMKKVDVSDNYGLNASDEKKPTT